MAYANDKFEILIGELKEIIDSMYAKYDNITLPNNGISRSKILRALFKDPDMTKAQASNISKINTARHSLKNQKIENCMKSLLELDDYDETFTDLSVKIDLILTAPTQSSSRKKQQEDLPDYKQLAREDNYSRIDKIRSDFSNEISALYNHYDPYPWFNFDNFNLYKNNCDDPSEYENSIICHKLLYLVLFTGLHINHIQNTKTFYADINLPGFMQFKEANKQSILYGPPCCGKTAFLKNYAIKNRSSVFYVDVKESSKSPDEYETILETLRPDYKFWKNDPEDIAKDTPIPNELLTAYINPWGTYSEISSQVLKEVISTDDTLILDNITSTEQLKYYSDFLPCHIIFVTNQPHLYSEIPTYDFCSHNKDNLGKILKGMINHNLKNTSIETLTPKIEAGLYSNLGTDLYVYRLVALNYVKLILASGTDDANDFLHQIVSSREIEPFNRSINPYAKHKLPMQAKSGESTSRYIRNFIRWIYKTNLTDIQQKILHFLYRCQVISDGKISVQDLYPYLGSNISALTKKLIDLGWITEDSFKIPLIIASSLNDIKNFTNQEYSEFLNMMGHFFVILRGFTSIPINKEICMLLIHAIHEDFQSYIKPRGEKPSNEVQKNFYNNLNKMSPEDRSEFRETGISSEYYQHDENDPIGNSQFMYWLIVNEFYCSAILFTLQYGFIDEAKDLLQFASNVENISYFTDNNINNLIWKLRITILADSSVVNNSVSHLGLLDDTFQQYVNYQPKNKNGIGRRHYDDKPVLITMYHQALLDFQYAALALWKDTRSYLNSDPERINMAARACIVPFCSLKMYKLKYNLIYPEGGKDGLLEYRILNQIFNLFDKISKALSGSPEFLFPAWSIDDSLSDEVSSYKIYSQYHILFQTMQVYYFIFINQDTASVPELQNELRTLLEDNQNNQLPTFIDVMAGYAMSLT